MKSYYNEIDNRAAQWLRNLISDGLIPMGDVDERDIKLVKADDLAGYIHCHFFAGIGGWAYALCLAGWSNSVPVWTGSCPCQPLSCAGQREGEMDERHLWPEFYRLIAECRPATVFGEQVASSDGLEWLDGVSLDLEEIGYAIGSADLPAACEGAPHRRQRLWWVADANLPRENGRAPGGEQSVCHHHHHHSEPVSAVADAASIVGDRRGNQSGRESDRRTVDRRNRSRLEHAQSDGREQGRPESSWWGIASRCGSDGLRRRLEPGLEPLAARLPGRLDLIRGYGNAIVPQVAARFIQAYIESKEN